MENESNVTKLLPYNNWYAINKGCGLIIILHIVHNIQTLQLSIFGSDTQYFEHNLNTSIPFLIILLQFLTMDIEFLNILKAKFYHFITKRSTW